MHYTNDESSRSRLTRARVWISLLVISACMLLGGRAQSAPQSSTPEPAVLVGAGDIASCTDYYKDEATAKLLDNILGNNPNAVVFTVGDNVYPAGSLYNFKNCYGDSQNVQDYSWGDYKARTRPSPGNHDYLIPGAAGYFAYFDSVLPNTHPGYYSYDLGSWHIVSLNSNIALGPGSAQLQWLQADLAADDSQCTLAYWHHPLFSSGEHGNQEFVRPLFKVLYQAGAEVVINGHDHLYERFAPQDPYGRADPTGIREFIVGTGGGPLYGFVGSLPNSEVRNNTTHGVLKFTLQTGSYNWEFVPVAGKSFSDSGSADCFVGTRAPAPPPAPEPPPEGDEGDEGGESDEADEEGGEEGGDGDESGEEAEEG